MPRLGSKSDVMDSAHEETRAAAFTPPAHLSAITTRYDILAECGRGGMGVVYKARDRQTDDVIAIKVLNPAIASEPGLIDRFKTELRLARKITHKHVCRVHDFNEFAGTAVISMEFVQGESLRDLLRRPEGISIRQGLKIAHQVLAALGEAHAQGIIHRDLKPANILVGRDGNVKVMDFGIARAIDSHETSTGVIIGTPAYMSPEQAEGRRPDARSDIYSLGLVLYEIFCGQPAFAADTAVAILSKQIHEVPRSPRVLEPDLPVRIERAILKCLEKDREKRFQSVAELDLALDEPPVVQLTTAVREDTVPVPLHLTRWQRSDVFLVAAAVFGLSLFFPLFTRTSLAPRSQLTFDQSVLRRIIQDYLRGFGVSPSKEVAAGVYSDFSSYSYLAEQHGASIARDLTNNPVHYWSWWVRFQDRTSVEVNNRGELVAFSRGGSPDSKATQEQDARPVAEKALVDAWKLAPSALNLESNYTARGVNYFTWVNTQGPYGLQERYHVWVDARGVRWLQKYFGPPVPYQANNVDWTVPVSFAMFLIIAALGFLHRRRIDINTRWRTVLGAVAFPVGVAYALFDWNWTRFVRILPSAVGFGLLFSVAWLLGSVAVEFWIRKTHPAKLRSLVGLFGPQVMSEPSGLSILRGTFIGLALLGIDGLVIWLGTTYFGAYLSGTQIWGFGRALGSWWPVTGFFPVVWMQSLGIGLLVAFVVSSAERLIARPWLRVIASTLLLAAGGVHISMGSVQPYQWMIAVLFIDYFFLVLAFRRFDLLTLFAAIFTFAFCWLNYPFVVIQWQMGPVWPLTAFALWGLFVAFAALVTFQSPLRHAYQRVTASIQ